MQLDAWTTETPADAQRRKRLTVGYLVGGVTVAAALSVVAMTSHGKVFEQDDTIDVSLSKAPEIAPEPEPEPEPKPKPRVQKPRKRKRNSKVAVSVPKDVPDTVPAESDPGGNPYDEEDFDGAFGEGGGDGTGTDGPKKVVKQQAEKKAEPTVAAPEFESERASSTPPVQLTRSIPRFPASAHATRATVIIRYRVSRSGAVSSVKVLKPHPDGAVTQALVSAVKAWKFRPATYDGQPVSRWRTARFPFGRSS